MKTKIKIIEQNGEIAIVGLSRKNLSEIGAAMTYIACGGNKLRANVVTTLMELAVGRPTCQDHLVNSFKEINPSSNVSPEIVIIPMLILEHFQTQSKTASKSDETADTLSHPDKNTGA